MISTIQHQPGVPRHIMGVVAAVLVLSAAFYFNHFDGPLSNKNSDWGAFGDFMGGVINPIVGFCTVWLLIVTLKQNQSSMRQQVNLADQTRDMASAAAVTGHLYVKCARLAKALEADLTPEQIKSLKGEHQRITRLASELDRLLEYEAARLLQRHNR